MAKRKKAAGRLTRKAGAPGCIGSLLIFGKSSKSTRRKALNRVEGMIDSYDLRVSSCMTPDGPGVQFLWTDYVGKKASISSVEGGYFDEPMQDVLALLNAKKAVLTRGDTVFVFNFE